MFGSSPASTGRARPIKSASSRPMERLSAREPSRTGEQASPRCATTSGEEPPTVAVAIEAPHGPVVEILLERRFQVDAVNPKQLDRFRDRFTVAGAKDDRRDAYVLADALRTDRHCFRRLTVEDPVVIELREW